MMDIEILRYDDLRDGMLAKRCRAEVTGLARFAGTARGKEEAWVRVFLELFAPRQERGGGKAVEIEMREGKELPPLDKLIIHTERSGRLLDSTLFGSAQQKLARARACITAGSFDWSQARAASPLLQSGLRCFRSPHKQTTMAAQSLRSKSA
jgi:hypothetical protein